MNDLRAITRQLVVALGVLIGLTVVVGVAYPALIWALGRIDANSADGSPVADRNGCVVGSALLGVDPQVAPGTPDKYLHARPGAVTDDNPLAPGDPAASGGSNLGPSSDTLAAQITQRRQLIAAREGVRPDQVPVDAVTRSGSGLDPDISTAYADLQVPRIARITGKTPDQVRAIIAANTHGRQWGFLGEQRVNVLRVNLALGYTAPHCK